MYFVLSIIKLNKSSPTSKIHKARKWVGIILIIVGTSLAIAGYYMNNECISVSRQLECFFTSKALQQCSFFNIAFIIIGASSAVVGLVITILRISDSKESFKVAESLKISPLLFLILKYLQNYKNHYYLS